MTEFSSGSGKTSISVSDSLRSKHRDPVTPPTFILPSLDHLPQFQDLDITGTHIQFVALQLQGVLALAAVMFLIVVICCSIMIFLVRDFIILWLLFVGI